LFDVDGLNPEANPGAPSTRATPALHFPDCPTA
jgi:hypothetical protein